MILIAGKVRGQRRVEAFLFFKQPCVAHQKTVRTIGKSRTYIFYAILYRNVRKYIPDGSKIPQGHGLQLVNGYEVLKKFAVLQQALDLQWRE